MANYDKKIVSACYKDKDFFDRTTFKHICDYGLEPLMRDSKVVALLKTLWDGESCKCNGAMTDYSMLAYLSTAPVRDLPN